MKHTLFIALLSVSAIAVARPLQEKLRIVASRTTEIKENIKSGAYFAPKNCVGACSSCKTCRSCISACTSK